MINFFYNHKKLIFEYFTWQIIIYPYQMTDSIQYTFQSDWFIQILSNNILPINLYILKFVSKPLTKIVDELLPQIIIKKFKSLFKPKHCDLIMKYINTNHLVISGSFIIQCILNEYYEDSDIDLYDYSGTSVKDNYLNILNINTETLKYPQTANFIDTYDNLVYIDTVINRKFKNGKNIQTIIINSNDVTDPQTFKNYMIQTFDLNICKNMFTYIDNKPFLYIHAPFKLINKHDTILGNYLGSKTIGRIQKYMNRGFSIDATLSKSDYFQYSTNSTPFMVYKNDIDGNFEKLSFLDKVLSKDDIENMLNDNGGKMLIYATPEKSNKIKKSLLLGIQMSPLLKGFSHNLTNFKFHKCYNDCHIKNLLKIKHKHYHFDAIELSKDSELLYESVIVNYDDLDENIRKDYDVIFDSVTNDEKFFDIPYMNLEKNVKKEYKKEFYKHNDISTSFDTSKYQIIYDGCDKKYILDTTKNVFYKEKDFPMANNKLNASYFYKIMDCIEFYNNHYELELEF
jgi:hypothetical protein